MQVIVGNDRLFDAGGTEQRWAPQGHMFRKQDVVTTPAEVRQIDQPTSRIASIDPSDKLLHERFGDQ